MSLPTTPRIHSAPHGGWRTLAERLRAIGLTPRFVARIQEFGMGLTTGRQHTLWVAQWRREQSPAAIALRMLMLGDPVSESDAANAVGSDLFAAMRESGLVVRHRSGWASPFTLGFLDGLFLFSDRTSLEPETVLAVSNTTQLLARASCSDRSIDYECVLDLGCGCGALAIRLAQCSRRVLATDLNPRAVRFAEFNAALNGAENIEFAEGDLYAPAQSEEFDLIVCQPPFIARAPHVEAVVCLHAGGEGDEVARRVLRDCEPHLKPGGRLLMLNDWPMREGEAVSIVPRVRQALSGLQARLVVLLSEPVDISTHCSSYASQGHSEDALAQEIGESLDHFHSIGIASVRQALCVVERIAGHSSSDRAYELHVPAWRWTNIRRTDIDRIFAALSFQQDGIESHLSSRIRVAPGTTFTCKWTSAPEEGQLFADPPNDTLFPTLPIDSGALQLIQTLDRASDIQTGINELAAEGSVPPEVLYPHVESALATGLTRGILSLSPQNHIS